MVRSSAGVPVNRSQERSVPTFGDVLPKSDRISVFISSASSGGRETNIFRLGLDSNVFTTVKDCFRDEPFIDDFMGDIDCDIFSDLSADTGTCKKETQGNGNI